MPQKSKQPSWEEKVRQQLYDFALTFANVDDPEKGHWWGHDTDLGTCKEEFDLATKGLTSLLSEARKDGIKKGILQMEKPLLEAIERVREEERQRLLEEIKEMRSGGISLEDDRVCKDIMENKGNELSHLHEAMYYKIRQFDEALSQIKELRQNEK